MASITVNEMRAVIANAYPGEGWKYRVNNLMKDNQVIAVYQAYLRREERKKQKEKEEGKWIQMTIADWQKEINNDTNHSNMREEI